jgi:Tfp pilus assembly protein PilO
MKASTKRLLTLFGSATLILVALIIYVSYLQPEYANIQNLRGELKARSDFYDAQSQAIDYVNNLYGKNQVDIQQIQNNLTLALPDQDNVASVVYQIQSISALNSISINSINLETLPIQRIKSGNSLVQSYGTLRTTLKMSGSYPSFKILLNFLENNIRLMDVRTLRVYQTDTTNKSVFDFELVVDTYYQVQ